MKNIYVSYAPGDAQRAEEVQRILQAQTYRPWLDAQPIEGADWHVGIDTAIQAADALVLLVTAEACGSTQVTYEWAFALGAGVPIFAIIYENAREHPRLQTVNRHDARVFGDENHFWDHFVDDINRQMANAADARQSIRRESQESFEIDKTVMPTEPGYWLVMRRGPLPNQLFRLERAIVNIGRDLANDIVIPDAQVSRYHLRLKLQGQDYLIEDLGSTNGARLNDVQLGAGAALNDGDVITLGDSIILTYDLVYLD